MKSRITLRDIFFFLLGVLITFIVSALWEWNEARLDVRDETEEDQTYQTDD